MDYGKYAFLKTEDLTKYIQALEKRIAALEAAIKKLQTGS